MLNFYKENSVYEINQIEWWLLKYSDEYKATKKNWNCNYCPTEQELPCICENPSEEWKFLKVYEELDEVSEFHKNEEYFKREIETYHKIKNSKEDLIRWVSKNERLGADEYLSFPYRDDEKEIRIFAYPLDIIWTINKNDFRYTIEFLEVFKKHFWHEQLLPNSIERIIKEMD